MSFFMSVYLLKVYSSFHFSIAQELNGISINDDVYAIIWTTTPWTLPANQVNINFHDYFFFKKK